MHSGGGLPAWPRCPGVIPDTNLPRMTVETVVRRLRSLGSREGEELRYAAAVSVWVRIAPGFSA